MSQMGSNPGEAIRGKPWFEQGQLISGATIYGSN